MTELDPQVQVKLIDIARILADKATPDFKSKTAESETWLISFGHFYHNLIKRVTLPAED